MVSLTNKHIIFENLDKWNKIASKGVYLYYTIWKSFDLLSFTDLYYTLE